MSQEKKNIRIQQRVDTKENWLSINADLLLEDEIGFEKETGQFKIGDGVHAWKDLSYAGIGQGTDNGGEIFNDYENNQATGVNSHAEGSNTIASLPNSHSEGLNTSTCVLYYPDVCFEKTTYGDGTYRNTNTILIRFLEPEIAEGMYVSTIYNNTKYRGVIKKVNGVNIELDDTDADTLNFIESVNDYFNLFIEGGKYGTMEYTEENFTAHVEGARNSAYINAHAEGCDNEARGYSSHAEGRYTIAQGEYSHTEGHSTIAKGHTSHSEGVRTKALGKNSHAEGGDTTASGTCSHVEGVLTNATGENSHAEGNNTTASNSQAHAEGNNTIAKGANSHAEGLGTIAAGGNQHVQGKYNKEDTTMAHIVGWGSGSAVSDRKNIHTLDTNGNAWFLGNVTVGINNEQLATLNQLSQKADTSYVDNLFNSIINGEEVYY